MWAVKYGAGILPTQSNLVLRGHGNSTKCPCCGGVEDTNHLFRCPSEEIKKAYEEERDKLHEFLSATTSFEIRENILRLLDGMRTEAPPQLEDGSPTSKAVYHQARMGQRAATNGVWLNCWTEIQDTFLKRMKSR